VRSWLAGLAGWLGTAHCTHSGLSAFVQTACPACSTYLSATLFTPNQPNHSVAHSQCTSTSRAEVSMWQRAEQSAAGAEGDVI
jgi:hypothetical protein